MPLATERTRLSDDDTPTHRYTAALAQEIELRWQERWDVEGTFEAPNPAGPLADPDGVAGRGRKLFVLDMFPYPSGTGLHVGHPLGFIGTDVYSRYQRMTGHNVLYTMGFDAFGLPAEQYAVQTGTHPAITDGREHRHVPPPDPPPRPEPRPPPLDRHHRPRLLPLDAVDLPADLRVVVRPRGRQPGAAPGAPARSASCAPSWTPAPAQLDDGRAWAPADGRRAGRRHRRLPPGLRLRRAGQLVPGPGHRPGQRGGHRRRPQRPSATSRSSSATCASG